MELFLEVWKQDTQWASGALESPRHIYPNCR